MNYFELDPVHFYTTPSLTWSAGIKTTNVTLELLTDINMYLMLESGIRGGMCLVSKRYSKANNKYLDNFDEMSPSKFIISLDVNNLYGTAMAFYNLPESEFRFLNQKEIDKFDLMSVSSDSNVGYILEVDLFYPPELHSKHNSFPMAPQHESIIYELKSLTMQASVICIKKFLTNLVHTTFPSLVTVLLSYLCLHFYFYFNCLTQKVFHYSPEEFGPSQQLDILRQKAKIDEIFENLQDIFSKPSVFVTITHLLTCCSFAGMGMVGGSFSKTNAVKAVFYSLPNFVSLIALLSIAGGLPVEQNKLKSAFYKKAHSIGSS
ncbi:uncharacterized protein TNCT_501051 [Trichonephila clavata]|uniref:DNA-directed DNA polymerase n=1 Tax=Trichonephila clavata TaxID=2740835 RepID=A0A8X6IEZ7_TRICU|nr:uncharacterized protein TNCT_501051 [Trichonephila clavata]